jgi:hypothetical protein
MPGAPTPAVLGRRMCAVLAAGSAALHAVMLGNAANPTAGVVMAAMIVGCLYCAYDLWLHGTLRGWCVVAQMNLAMIALHLPAPGHHHSGTTATAVGDPSTIMAAATLVAAVEVTAATVVLYYRTRGRVIETFASRLH